MNSINSKTSQTFRLHVLPATQQHQQKLCIIKAYGLQAQDVYFVYCRHVEICCKHNGLDADESAIKNSVTGEYCRSHDKSNPQS